MCCDSWGRKESDMTERLNWTEQNWCFYSLGYLFSWVFRVELLDCMRNIYSYLWEIAKLFSNIFVQFYITNSNVWEFQFFNIQLTLSIKMCFNFILLMCHYILLWFHFTFPDDKDVEHICNLYLYFPEAVCSKVFPILIFLSYHWALRFFSMF